MFGKPIEAVLFDMDGLLIDTEAVYLRALVDQAAAMGREMPLAFGHSMIGIPGRECDGLIQDFFGPDFPLARFNQGFDEHVQRQLVRGIPVKTGVAEILDFLAGRGMPLAIATSSSRKTAERHLRGAGLIDRFATVATRDDVERGKPHPDLFLEAARRLGVAPDRCVVLEDSNNGILAAHAAGTLPIMVPDIVQPLPGIREKCVDVVEDLHAALRLLKAALPSAYMDEGDPRGHTRLQSRSDPGRNR